MSSFPKHSYEQSYDHAFPSSHHQSSTPARPSERSRLITKAPLSTAYNTTNNNHNTHNTATDLPVDIAAVAAATAPTLPDYSTVRPPSYDFNDEDDQDKHKLRDRDRGRGRDRHRDNRGSSTETLFDANMTNSNDDGDGDGDGDEGEEEEEECGKYMSIQDLTRREFKILLRYSGPVVLTYILQNSLQLASLVSLGHLGSI
ncbi:hypothetical protein BX616_006928, partial [Lobosporangium transversale]